MKVVAAVLLEAVNLLFVGSVMLSGTSVQIYDLPAGLNRGVVLRWKSINLDLTFCASNIKLALIGLFRYLFVCLCLPFLFLGMEVRHER